MNLAINENGKVVLADGSPLEAGNLAASHVDVSTYATSVIDAAKAKAKVAAHPPIGLNVSDYVITNNQKPSPNPVSAATSYPLSPPLTPEDVKNLGKFPTYTNLPVPQVANPVTGVLQQLSGSLPQSSCSICGAVVFDAYKHTKFHASMAKVLGLLPSDAPLQSQ